MSDVNIIRSGAGVTVGVQYRGRQGIQGPAGEILSVTATGLPTGSNPTITLGGSTSQRTIVIGVPTGPVGPQGQGVQDDPGDFTLLFENQLI